MGQITRKPASGNGSSSQNTAETPGWGGKREGRAVPEKAFRPAGALLFLSVSDGGIFQKAKRTSFAVQVDIRKLDRHIEQLDFLQKYEITTREQLAGHRKPLEEKMLTLTKERHRLYRAEPESPRIDAITKELKSMRKEVRLCLRIEQHSKEIEEKLLAVKELVEKKEARTQETKREGPDAQRR